MTSFTDPLPNVVVQNFYDWVRGLMHRCGGKDVYNSDGSIVKGAFEGFAQGGGVGEAEHQV